jgi:hypothetical protein
MKTSDRKTVSESDVNERETNLHLLMVTKDTDSVSREVSNKYGFFVASVFILTDGISVVKKFNESFFVYVKKN